MLTDILTADLAQVSVRQNRTAMQQNEDMRRISAWAAIALVPTAVAGIYGMNFDNMPELRWKYGYFVVLGVIALVAWACTGCSGATAGCRGPRPLQPFSTVRWNNVVCP